MLRQDFEKELGFVVVGVELGGGAEEARQGGSWQVSGELGEDVTAVAVRMKRIGEGEQGDFEGRGAEVTGAVVEEVAFFRVGVEFRGDFEDAAEVFFGESREGKQFFEVEALDVAVANGADFAECAVDAAGFDPAVEAGGEVGFAFSQPGGEFAGEEALGLGIVGSADTAGEVTAGHVAVVIGFDFDLSGGPAVTDGDDEFGPGGHGGDVLIVAGEVDLAADFELATVLAVGDDGTGVVGAESEEMAVWGGLGDGKKEKEASAENERGGGGRHAIAGAIEEGFETGENLLAATGTGGEEGSVAERGEFGDAGEGFGVGLRCAGVGDDPIVAGHFAFAVELAADEVDGGVDEEHGAEEAFAEGGPVVAAFEMGGFVKEHEAELIGG